ncbi:putative bacterial protein of the PRK05287 family [Candidatus Kinetoplastibacterium galatii TCC219]|uniref:Putative bacterial protein of the PRK05287 family n=1 Tax=Candidatus Kinetoplastidibacterium galati TCC219 TaxID=1208921 RepID=M1LXL9_9PROT|nr:putative bacterial protein of the PRK05287 family [Candidatus Kinetoplastibacterium galatii TCC219]
MRLEYLFDRLFFTIQSSENRLHQIAISTLFEIIDAIDRSDVKGSILQDLEKQRLFLLNLRRNKNVNQRMLELAISELSTVSSNLISSGRPGHALRENEWLNSLRGKLLVSGCAAQADMPSYYFWQNKDESIRRKDLNNWTSHISPLFESLKMVLSLLRESGNFVECVSSNNGEYQKMLGGREYQLLRLCLYEEQEIFPEISANKHMISIRFSMQDSDFKSLLVRDSIAFKIAFCR